MANTTTRQKPCIKCGERHTKKHGCYPWEAECLSMVAERLESYGLDMRACPPMMYDDAITHIVNKLALALGLKTLGDVERFVCEVPDDA